MQSTVVSDNIMAVDSTISMLSTVNNDSSLFIFVLSSVISVSSMTSSVTSACTDVICANKPQAVGEVLVKVETSQSGNIPVDSTSSAVNNATFVQSESSDVNTTDDSANVMSIAPLNVCIAQNSAGASSMQSTVVSDNIMEVDSTISMLSTVNNVGSLFSFSSMTSSVTRAHTDVICVSKPLAVGEVLIEEKTLRSGNIPVDSTSLAVSNAIFVQSEANDVNTTDDSAYGISMAPLNVCTAQNSAGSSSMQSADVNDNIMAVNSTISMLSTVNNVGSLISFRSMTSSVISARTHVICASEHLTIEEVLAEVEPSQSGNIPADSTSSAVDNATFVQSEGSDVNTTDDSANVMSMAPHNVFTAQISAGPSSTVVSDNIMAVDSTISMLSTVNNVGSLLLPVDILSFGPSSVIIVNSMTSSVTSASTDVV